MQKVNTLVANHMDYMENPYQGHAKGVFLIGLMPKANGVEGRILRKKLDIPGDINSISDVAYVVQECAKIVLESQTSTTDTSVASALAVSQRRTCSPECARFAMRCALRS